MKATFKWLTDVFYYADWSGSSVLGWKIALGKRKVSSDAYLGPTRNPNYATGFVSLIFFRMIFIWWNFERLYHGFSPPPWRCPWSSVGQRTTAIPKVNKGWWQQRLWWLLDNHNDNKFGELCFFTESNNFSCLSFSFWVLNLVSKDLKRSNWHSQVVNISRQPKVLSGKVQKVHHRYFP